MAGFAIGGDDPLRHPPEAGARPFGAFALAADPVVELDAITSRLHLHTTLPDPRGGTEPREPEPALECSPGVPGVPRKV